MTFRIQPLKGIYRPVNYRYQLHTAEAFTGYKRYAVLLVFLSLCMYAIGAALGIGTESLSKELTSLSYGEYEARKQLFFVGRLLLGLLIPCLFLFLGALYYWSFLDIPYQKLVIIQMTVFCVFLLEKAIQIPMFVLWHIDAISNPFSFGIIAQYITNKEFIIHFFSKITVFQIVMMSITNYYLCQLTDQSKKVVTSIVIFFFVFCWIISSLLSYIKIGFFF